MSAHVPFIDQWSGICSRLGQTKGGPRTTTGARITRLRKSPLYLQAETSGSVITLTGMQWSFLSNSVISVQHRHLRINLHHTFWKLEIGSILHNYNPNQHRITDTV